MQRLSLMRIMKRQRMKYEEFESIYPVTIYHKTIPWIYNSCGSTANGRAENKRRSFHLA